MANIVDLGSTFVVTPPSGTTGTSMTVTSGTGSTLPTPPFYATGTPVGSLSTPNTSEIVLVTARSTDTLTIVRAQKGTTAKTWAAGWVFTNSIYKDDLFSSLTLGEVPSGTANGTNTVFTTAMPFTSIEVFKNGVRMKGGGSDYTVTNTTTITFVTAPASGAAIVVNYTMGNSVMIVGSNSLITDAPVTPAPTGSTTVFTVPQSYVAGSLEVFINGIKQKRVVHFTESSPGAGTFTMSDAPLTGDDIMVNYQFTNGVSGNADTVDGFHANATPMSNSLLPLDINSKFPASVLSTNVQTYTNTGDGGGTGYYMTLGGVKLCWGTSGVITVSTARNLNVTYPVGFFNTIQTSSLTPVNMSTTAMWTNMAPANPSTSGQSMYEGGNGTTALTWFAIGA